MGLVDRGFAADTGAVPPDVAAALAAYAEDAGALPGVLAALQGSRLLLAMVEVEATVFERPAGEETAHHHPDHGQPHHHDHPQGHPHEHERAMAAVSVQRPDGRRGLLAFTGVEPLARWDATARPLPVTTREAAETALRDGARALVVDIAGPVRLAVEGEDLSGLAQGWTLARIGGRSAWIRPATE